MTEFKITQWTQPSPVTFNYEELKAEIEEKAKTYETLVYTDESIGDAKKDRANLNKLSKALNDERIKREKEFMQPFEDFKAKVNEIISIINKPIGIIDKQVKEYEEQEKQKKREKINELWESTNRPQWLRLEQIWNEKWLNKSFTEKAIQEEMQTSLDGIAADIDIISKLPEFSFEAMETYKTCLRISTALAEGQRLADIQKRKAEEEARKASEQKIVQATEPTDPAPTETTPKVAAEKWMRFQALLDREKAIKLSNFCKANGIEIKPIS